MLRLDLQIGLYGLCRL